MDHRAGPLVSAFRWEAGPVIILGLILLIAGYLAGISILTTIGVILLVVGAVLALLGGVGRPVGGRRWYY